MDEVDTSVGPKEQKIALEAWRDLTDTNTLNNSVGALAESMASSSSVTDRAATWAAAGIGAAGALAIVHINIMISVFGPTSVKWLFSALACSGFFAIIEKYFAVKCISMVHVLNRTKESLGTVFEQHQHAASQIAHQAATQGVDVSPQFQLMDTLREFRGLFPWWFRWIKKRAIDKAEKDPKQGYRILIHCFVYQQLSALLEYAGILAFIVLAAVFI